MNFTNTLKGAALVVAVASTMLLSACGSSSAPPSDSSSVPGSVGCTANQNTVNDSGSGLNQVQQQIQGAYFPSGGGDAGAALLCSTSHVLNVVNDLVAGLKAAGKSKDPSALNPYLQNVGTQLTGALGNLVLVITNLQNNLVNLVPADKVPALGNTLTQLLNTLKGVEANLVSGYTNQDGTVNLSVLTDAVNNTTSKVLGPLVSALETALGGATGNIPVLGQVVISLGGLLNTTLGNLSGLLTQVGSLSNTGISNGISTLVSGLINGLAGLTGSGGPLEKLLVTSPLGGVLSSLLGPGGTLSSLLSGLLAPVGGLLSGLLNTLLCPVLSPSTPACQGSSTGSGGGAFGG